MINDFERRDHFEKINNLLKVRLLLTAINSIHMELYTFIMEFRGGTYISQVQAEHLNDSVKLWGRRLEVKDIQHLGEKGKNELLAQLNDEELTKVSTVKNVWYFGLSIRKGYVAVNVVKTSKTN